MLVAGGGYAGDVYFPAPPARGLSGDGIARTAKGLLVVGDPKRNERVFVERVLSSCLIEPDERAEVGSFKRTVIPAALARV